MLRHTGALVLVLAFIASSASASARARRPHLKALENASIAQLMLSGSLASRRGLRAPKLRCPTSPSFSSVPMVAEDLYRPR
jgi:hypothetical protein